MSTAGMFEYKGYLGSVNASTEDNCLWGKLEFISATVTYEADTVNDLETAFHEAVDDYLDTCKQQGYTAEKPCKGTFNVRTKSQTHRDLTLIASQCDKSLNEVANEAFQIYIGKNRKKEMADIKAGVKKRHKSRSDRGGKKGPNTRKTA